MRASSVPAQQFSVYFSYTFRILSVTRNVNARACALSNTGTRARARAPITRQLHNDYAQHPE